MVMEASLRSPLKVVEADLAIEVSVVPFREPTQFREGYEAVQRASTGNVASQNFVGSGSPSGHSRSPR